MVEDNTTVVRETDAVNGAAVQRQTVRRDRTTSGAIIAKRIVWFIMGLIIALLAFRIALLLLAANEGAPFVDFIYSVSSIFAAPFYGIFSYTPSYGKSVLEISSLVAIAVYALVGWGIAKLVTLTRPRNEI